MHYIITSLLVLAWVVFLGTFLMTGYLAIFTILAFIRPLRTYRVGSPSKKRKMAVLIPAYKEDQVIISTAKHALTMNYPTDLYEVVVIADSLKATTLATLRLLPIRVVEVTFEQSTKVKALNAALDELPDTFDVALILDADNHLAPDFLQLTNQCFDEGWLVVQGHRVAKNTNTSVAILDAVSEEINNYIFRKGHRAAGLPALLSGSGMAFDYDLLKRYIPIVQTTGGFDRALELQIINDGLSIEFLEEALCYDEKVQNAAVFERQRTRWIAAQLKYLMLNAYSGVKALFTGNISLFDKVVQLALLPRVMLLGLQMAGFFVSLLFDVPALSYLTGIQLLILLVIFYVAIPKSLRALVTWRELLVVPTLFFRFFRALFKMGEAKRKFIHTPHDVVS